MHSAHIFDRSTNDRPNNVIDSGAGKTSPQVLQVDVLRVTIATPFSEPDHLNQPAGQSQRPVASRHAEQPAERLPHSCVAGT
jgi:hypothetical protein